MTLLDLYNTLLQVGITVAHYEAELDEYPYITYQEIATTYQHGSGHPWREDVAVEVVHFTQKEFDPTLEKLKYELHKSNISFTIAHGYDPDEKVIINQFALTITRDLEH